MYWYCISVKSFWSTPLYIFWNWSGSKTLDIIFPVESFWSALLSMCEKQFIFPSLEFLISSALHFENRADQKPLTWINITWIDFLFILQVFHAYVSFGVTLRRHKCIFLFKFSLHVPSDQRFNNLIFWIVYYMYVSFRIIAVLIFTCTCV